MGPIDFSIHLLSFFAPAFAVAVLVALAGRLVLPRNNPPKRWWLPVSLNFLAGAAALAGGLVLPASGRGPWWLSLGLNALAGAAVLAAGLWYFGRDGKMATYAALVLVVATVQWLSGRAWRS